MTGVDSFAPEDFRSGYNNASLLRGAVTAEQTKERENPLHKKLFEHALVYMQEANITLPHATLEVKGHEAVLKGIPHGSQLLVCAVDDDGEVHNYL